MIKKLWKPMLGMVVVLSLFVFSVVYFYGEDFGFLCTYNDMKVGQPLKRLPKNAYKTWVYEYSDPAQEEWAWHCSTHWSTHRVVLARDTVVSFSSW